MFFLSSFRRFGSFVLVMAGVALATTVARAQVPTITAQPQSLTLNLGQSATFSVGATSSTTGPTYQWRKGGAPISGATLASYAIDEVVTGSAGSYDVQVTNTTGTVTSNAAILTANLAPVVGATSYGRYPLNPGQNLTLTLSSAISGSAAVQWRRNGLPLAGATARSLAITNAGRTSGGYYQAVYNEGSGAVISAPIFVLVGPAAAQVLGWGYDIAKKLPAPAAVANVVATANVEYVTLILKGDGTVSQFSAPPFGGTIDLGILPSNVVALSGARYHFVLLKADGTVVQAVDPTGGAQGSVPAGLNNVVSIAAGTSHNLALKSDGTVVAWGDGGSGTAVPAGLANASAIAAGNGFSLALKSDGTVVGWGANGNGQSTPPVGLNNVVAIAAAGSTSLALKSDGTVVGWGYNGDGQATIPSGLVGVAMISTDGNHSLALRADGTVVGWGSNFLGSLDFPSQLNAVSSLTAASVASIFVRDTAGDTMPAIVTQPTGVAAWTGQDIRLTVAATGGTSLLSYQWRKGGTAIVGATDTTLAFRDVTTAVSGNYDVVVSNQLGAATSNVAAVTVNATPGVAINLTGRQVVAAGQNLTLTATAAISGPVAYQWRRNGSDIAGATSASFSVAGASPRDSGAYQVVATNSVGPVVSGPTFVAVTVASQIVAWGTNAYGQTTVPAGLGGALAVAAGVSHSLAAKADGTIVAWGSNISGETAVPSGLSGVVAVAAGENYSMALRSDGTVTTWGAINYAPSGLAKVISVAAGYRYAMALKSDRTVVAWDANAIATDVPTTLTNIVGIAGGFHHQLALKSDGTVVAWGSNEDGQSSVPAGLGSVVAIAAGNYHSLALKADGTVVAWGDNSFNATNVPVGLTGVVAIVGTGNGSIALKADGTVVTWGFFADGSLMTPPIRAVTGFALSSEASHALLLRDTSGDGVPVISTQPTAATVNPGQSVSFSVVATAVPPIFGYQWRKNTVNISGATVATLTLPGVQAADAAGYDVVITNDIGSTTSSAAILTVNSAPVFSAQPTPVTVTQGQTATFSAAATGLPSPTYQWQKNTVNISGATNATLTFNSVQPADGASYRVIATNVVSAVTSNAVTLTVNVPAFISSQPVATTVVQGNTANFSVAASGNPSPTFQWQRQPAGTTGFVNLNESGTYSGVNASGLVVFGATAAMNGDQFRCVATNSVNSDTSVAVTLTVNVGPVFSVQPVAATVTQGQTATFSATATGNPAPTYQWQKNSVNISGATNATLTLNNVQPADGATYRVVATNVVSTATSTAVTLTVNVPATISSQPVAATVTQGNTANFSVASSGTPTPTLQWQRQPAGTTGFVNLSSSGTYSGVTSSALAVFGTTAGMTGDQFRCVATNSVNSDTSQAVVLTVNSAPVFSVQPVAVTVTQGQTATFSATATGNPAPTYQWQKNSVNISGATNATLTINNVQPADGATYRLVATNVVNAVTSNAVTLTVNVGAAISSQPVATTLVQGNTATFSVAASGNPSPTFQWQRQPAGTTGFVNLTSGGTYSGALTSVLSIFNSVVAMSGDQFRCVVTNSVGSDTSQAATLTVVQGPTITSANNAVFAVGVVGSFTVNATGTPAPTFSVSSGVLPSWAALNSLTGVISGTPPNAAGSPWVFGLQANNGVGPSVTQTFTLTVTEPSVITSANAATFVAGTFGSFTFTGTGSPAPQFSISGAIPNGLSINSATGVLSGTPSTSSLASYVVTVFANNGIGPASQIFTITVNSAPAFLSQPSTQVVYAGQFASFGVSVSGNPAPTFQWRKAGVPIAGATAAFLSFNPAQASDSFTYDVVATNSVSSVVSNTVSLFVNAPTPPTISSQPLGGSLNVGNIGSFSVSASGTPAVTYQWRKNTTPVSGATNSFFSLGAVTATSGGNYDVVVSNVGGSVTSNTAVLVILPPVSIITNPVSTTVFGGVPVSLSVSAVGSPSPLSYQWRKNTIPLAGANGPVLSISAAVASDAGSYDVVVSTSAGSATSTAATLTVNDVVPSFTLQPVGATLAVGGSVTLTGATVGSQPMTYQWSKDGVALAGATSATLVITNAQTSQRGNYVLTATNPLGSVPSVTVLVNVVPRVVAYSARLMVDNDGAVAVFTIEGTQSKKVLLRAIGPGLAPFGLTGLPDPQIELFDNTGTLLAVNNDWASSSDAAAISATTAAVGAFAVTNGSKDAAIVRTLAPGTYSVRATPASGPGGTGYLELYDADLATGPMSTLPYVAVRGRMGAGGGVVIGGLGSNGRGVRSYLIRGVGPGLGLSGTLANPSLLVVREGALVGSNDDWDADSTEAAATTTATARVATFALSAAGRDAALVLTGNLHAGACTVQVGSSDLVGGTVLLEVHDLDPVRPTALAPVIVSPPVSTVVNSGSPVTLRGLASGSGPLSYQWRKEGVPIAGATNSTYSLAAVQAINGGSYTVAVQGTQGLAISLPAVVTVQGGGIETAATQTIVGGGYVSGSTVTISNTITYTGTVTGLGWSVALPVGWSFASDAGAIGDVRPVAGSTGTLGWAWSTPPASPVTFTYTVNVPAGTTGAQALMASAIIRNDGNVTQPVATPSPLMVPQLTAHSADTDADGRISLFELTRVIALYNTRVLTTRTGRYKVATSATEDGFDIDAVTTGGGAVTLSHYHSADSNRDGAFSLSELTRVIELYNTRSGTTRTGAYHVQAGSEDGYAPGP